MTEPVFTELGNALRRHYTIQREVGRGGTAFVFLARDLKHERWVAIKVLRPEIAVAVGVERFLREIRLVAQLQHPHVIPLYDSGAAAGWLYYVMPFVEGQSLRQRLDQIGPLPLDEALHITSEVCLALSYAHGQGIVHRDIKPENILLERSHALVADFGLARAVAVAGGEKLSETGMTVGTPAYMSPEQAGADDRLDGRSDLYSLGCVVYEMLAGAPPFAGPSAQALLARHAVDPVPPIRTVRKSVPRHLEEAVLKALEKVPADRFASAEQFAAAVNAPPPRAPLSFPGFLRVALWTVGLALVGAGGWLALRAREAAATPLRRIAVLPLRNLTGDSTQDYLVDGMHEAVVGRLARISSISVIARSSVLRFRGPERPGLPEMARILGVDVLVDGSVSRQGDSVAVTLDLIEGTTARHLWAATYVRALPDVLRLQGELATAIADQIRGAITPAERLRMESGRRVEPEVYELALKGGFACELWTKEALDRGTRLLREAVERDPTYAPAYARLAGCYGNLSLFGYLPPAQANPLMKAAVDQALELDSTLGEAYATRAWNRLVIDLDFGGPDGDFRRALTLSPGTAWIHHWYADYLTLAGRWEEAIARRRVAMALDPLSAPTSVGLGWTYFKARRYPESIAQLQRTLALAPDYFYAHMELAWNYSQQGMHVSAVAQCDSAIASAPLPEARDPSLCGWVYGRAGQRQRVLTQLRALTSASRQRWVDPFQVAILYVGLGDSDQALEWLRRAVREHAQSLAFLKVEPMLDPLRSDPRFQQLLEDLGIKS